MSTRNILKSLVNKKLGCFFLGIVVTVSLFLTLRLDVIWKKEWTTELKAKQVDRVSEALRPVTPKTDEKEKPIISTSVPKETKEHIILIYTTLFGRRPWPFFDKIEAFKDHHGNKCPVQNCLLSYERRLFETASVVVFHGVGDDIGSQRSLKLLSAKRKPNQIWVYFTHTIPRHVKPHPTFFNGFFNWTMTYQRNSDIMIPYSWELGTWQRRSHIDKPFNKVDYTKGRDKLVYAEINYCGLWRDNLIKKLQKYVAIDVYGRCSKHFHKKPMVIPVNLQQRVNLKKRYKFYLAFERDHCIDFITQRYYQTLVDNPSVPIVLGGADYGKVAIPQSYIDPMRFKTVKQLGDYIQFLDKNDFEYNKYHNWREDYILGPPTSWTCEICKKVNDKKLMHKTYKKLGEWYGEKNCDKDMASLKQLILRN